MKSIKTVNLSAGVESKIEMPDLHCHVRNAGTSTVYASRYSDISPYEDGVLEIKSGYEKTVRDIFDYQTRQGYVYLLSESDTSVELESANDVNFKCIVKGGDGSSSGETIDTFNKSEINSMLSEKADNSDVEDIKADITALQTSKANADKVYTKSETDNAITTQVAKIVADAPEDFDTLKEMSAWIESHEDSASAMNLAIQQNTADITAIENDVNKSSKWNLIPDTYTTIIDYSLSLSVGRHTIFWRNAYDTHITDMPVLDCNVFIEVYKYSNSTIKINAYPNKQNSDCFYTRCFNGGAWGKWYKFVGTMEE